MFRKYLQRIMPDEQTIREHPHLRRFGRRLADPKIWHLNRHAVALGLALGLFVAFLPMPFQMVLAAGLALLFRANLILAVLAVWITNPITMGPIYFVCYKVGALILDQPIDNHSFSMTWDWFSTVFMQIWQPLLLGSVVLGLVASIIGIIVVKLLWRWSVIRQWNQRRR